MKQGKLFILSAVLLCAGLAVAFVGFALLDFNVMNFDTEPPYVERSYSCPADVGEITLSDDNANLNIVASKDGKIHISYYENINKTYRIELSDGALSVTKQTEESFIDYLSISVSTPTLTLSLPADYSGEVNVDLGDGDISVEGTSIRSLTVNSDSGNVFVRDCVFKGYLDLKTDRGGIHIYETDVAENCKLSGKNGEVFLWSLTAGDVYANSRGGLITLAHVKAGTIHAEGTSKDIITSCISFETDAHLMSASGDIRGSVVGNEEDFSFYCTAPNGECNVGNLPSRGDKSLHVKTEQGDINLIFVLPETQGDINAD